MGGLAHCFLHLLRLAAFTSTSLVAKVLTTIPGGSGFQARDAIILLKVMIIATHYSPVTRRIRQLEIEGAVLRSRSVTPVAGEWTI